MAEARRVRLRRLRMSIPEAAVAENRADPAECEVRRRAIPVAQTWRLRYSGGETRKDGSFPIRPSRFIPLSGESAAEQLEHALRRAVGLGQHGCVGLYQN